MSETTKKTAALSRLRNWITLHPYIFAGIMTALVNIIFISSVLITATVLTHGAFISQLVTTLGSSILNSIADFGLATQLALASTAIFTLSSLVGTIGAGLSWLLTYKLPNKLYGKPETTPVKPTPSTVKQSTSPLSGQLKPTGKSNTIKPTTALPPAPPLPLSSFAPPAPPQPPPSFAPPPPWTPKAGTHRGKRLPKGARAVLPIGDALKKRHSQLKSTDYVGNSQSSGHASNDLPAEAAAKAKKRSARTCWTPARPKQEVKLTEFQIALLKRAKATQGTPFRKQCNDYVSDDEWDEKNDPCTPRTESTASDGAGTSASYTLIASPARPASRVPPRLQTPYRKRSSPKTSPPEPEPEPEPESYSLKSSAK